MLPHRVDIAAEEVGLHHACVPQSGVDELKLLCHSATHRNILAAVRHLLALNVAEGAEDGLEAVPDIKGVVADLCTGNSKTEESSVGATSRGRHTTFACACMRSVYGG